ncbi:hypothetical protein AB205_0005310, partial [Aquarana catesbeiana]
MNLRYISLLFPPYICSAGRFAIYHLIGEVRFASVTAWLMLHVFPYWASGCRCYYWLVLERQCVKAYGCSSVPETTRWRWSSEWDSGRGYLWDRRHVLGLFYSHLLALLADRYALECYLLVWGLPQQPRNGPELSIQ